MQTLQLWGTLIVLYCMVAAPIYLIWSVLDKLFNGAHPLANHGPNIEQAVQRGIQKGIESAIEQARQQRQNTIDEQR